MFYFHTKTFVAMLLLTFILQAIAAPVSCETRASSKTPESHHAMMQHKMPGELTLSHQTMSHQNKADKADCCDNDCSCPASVCSSFSIINNDTVGVTPLAQQHKVNQLPTALLRSTITSVFRPPIFA